MQVQLLSSDGLMREFRVVIPASDLNEKKTGYINSRAHKVKVDGFRPGKVPAYILEQRLGGDALNHALRASIDESIKAAAKGHNLQYINEPKVDFDEFEEGRDLTFKITFDVMPKIETKDFSVISLEKLVADVGEKEIEKSLHDLHKNHKAFQSEEGRTVQIGDRVSCGVSLTLSGKKVKDYQKVSVTLDVGANAFMLSGIDNQIVGMKAGDQKTFLSTVSPDFSDKEIAGREVEATLVVKQAFAPKTFELDDAFAKEFGQESFDALKSHLKENLRNNYNSIGRLYMKRHLLDELEKAYDFDLPESMVKTEFENIWQHLQNEISGAKARGDKIDDEDKSEEQLRTEYEKIAQRRVRLGLVISHIAKEEKIQLTQDELRNAIYREAMRYRGQERKVMEYYRNNPQMIDRIAAPLLEDKVVDFISTKAQTKEVKVDVEGLKKKVKGIVPTMFDDEAEEE